MLSKAMMASLVYCKSRSWGILAYRVLKWVKIVFLAPICWARSNACWVVQCRFLPANPGSTVPNVASLIRMSLFLPVSIEKKARFSIGLLPRRDVKQELKVRKESLNSRLMNGYILYPQD